MLFSTISGYFRTSSLPETVNSTSMLGKLRASIKAGSHRIKAVSKPKATRNIKRYPATAALETLKATSIYCSSWTCERRGRAAAKGRRTGSTWKKGFRHSGSDVWRTHRRGQAGSGWQWHLCHLCHLWCICNKVSIGIFALSFRSANDKCVRERRI